MDQIIKILFNEVNKAIKEDEMPVGCLIVKNNKIIAKSHNKKNKSNKITDHAEIICINKATKKLKDWRLNECELYVTLEPCNMCKEVIRQSRIKKVYYLLDSKFKNENNKEIDYIKISSNETVDYLGKIQSFFAKKR